MWDRGGGVHVVSRTNALHKARKRRVNVLV